ncbi:hypothetical protein CLV91_1628 [Maribacter vaceletii]|uniref:YD repeat-containing protein n=1 Tax=Maribacter vaceletii TaxID=1206816 RepID=A0A495E7Z3_9FLAO|nr:hypothetical protein [Maribacter vaceletii]RKR12916.1 hypothetical protein CLV91_1628 [Maribacter vaceletii]
MKNYTLYFFVFLFLNFFSPVNAQEIRIFSTKDFDLKDSVQTCLVNTKYGKEEYEFLKDGRLSKSITRHSDADYSITYYKYEEKFLIEKRFENYRENTFDPSTSIANIYTIDSTTTLKITEKILTYSKEFLEQYEYTYSKEKVLEKITRTNDTGIDTTVITFTNFKGENTKTYSLNGEVIKSIRTSKIKRKNTPEQKLVLTKTFLNGEAISAEEDIVNLNGKIVSKTKFLFNTVKKEFEPQEVIRYDYNENDMLIKTEEKLEDTITIKEYVYQYDDGDSGNWIKQIITPDNSYKTRTITYFE